MCRRRTESAANPPVLIVFLEFRIVFSLTRMLVLQAWLARRSADAGRHAARAARHGLMHNSSPSTVPNPYQHFSASMSCVCSATADTPRVQRPKPGTVKHYDYHFFIRNPTHMSAKDMDFARLWPPAIERCAT